MKIECNILALDPKNREELWREKLLSTFGPYQIRTEGHKTNMSGYFKSDGRDALRFSTLCYGGQSLHRTPADIAKLERQCIVLARPFAGKLCIDYGNNQNILMPGNIYLANHAIPLYATPHIEYATDAIAFPLSALKQRGAKPKPLETLSISSLQGRLINLVADQITNNYLRWNDKEFSLLTEQLFDLIALFFCSAGSPQFSQETSVRSAHLQRAYAVIRENFGDPDLSPTKIASVCGISISYLYNLFNTSNTSVREAVISERLKHGKKLLTSPQTMHLSIATITSMTGFIHPTHFSRVFRQEFGCTPKEFRHSTQNASSQIINDRNDGHHPG
jgi:AraC-like DNA-binding protein